MNWSCYPCLVIPGCERAVSFERLLMDVISTGLSVECDYDVGNCKNTSVI